MVCGVEDGFEVDVKVEVDGSTVDVDGCKVDVGRGLTKVVVVVVVWPGRIAGFSVVVGKEDEVVGGEEASTSRRGREVCPQYMNISSL